MKRIALLNIILSVLFILTSGCVNDSEPEIRSLIRVGDRLPQFDVVMNDGSSVTTQSLAGRPSVVLLFSTTCDDCRRFLPVVEDLHKELPELKIVCIARDGDAASISAYWVDNGLTLPYSPQPRRDVYEMFATGGVPRTYVSDAKLNVVAAWDDSPMPTAEEIAEAVLKKGL